MHPSERLIYCNVLLDSVRCNNRLREDLIEIFEKQNRRFSEENPIFEIDLT